MKPASIAGHVLELCVLAESSTAPADQITWTFFKQRTYLGARDRFRISSSLFGMQRAWRLIEWYAHCFFSSLSIERMTEGKEQYLPLYLAYAVLILRENTEELVTHLSDIWNSAYPSVSFSEYLKWLAEHEHDVQAISDEKERLGVQYSFPDWMVERLLSQYGKETEALLAGLNTPARTTLRVNRHTITREECRQRLLAEGIETLPTQYSPDGLITEKRFNRMASPAFKEWLYEFQDEGSQLISVIADPQPGQVVIDACAGGGGKTMHISEMMRQTGRLIAVDIDMKRMKGLQARIERANISGIELKTVETLNQKELFHIADVVLVDAPCSGSGRIRRSPDIKKHLKERHVAMYPSKQKEILLSNADFVKQGGTLVYATCSLFQSENEEIVQEFLHERSDFILESPSELVESLGLAIEQSGCIRILPHNYPTDGFFVAVFKRIQ